MIQGTAIWKFSNKMPCLSVFKYLIRGTKYIENDMLKKPQTMLSDKFKDITKFNKEQEQKSERHSLVVPYGSNQAFLINSDTCGSLYGITSLALRNLIMFPEIKGAGLIRSTMPFPSMQNMRYHLNTCKNTPTNAKDGSKIQGPICGISDKQGERKCLGINETTQDKKPQFCDPKKSNGELNKDSCASEETNAKTPLKQPPYCSKGDGKACMAPKTETPTKFCAQNEGKNDNDLCSSSKAQMNASAPTQQSKGDNESVSQPAYCTKSNAMNDPCTSPKMQMKASPATAAAPGPKGPPEQKEQKPTKKEDPPKQVKAATKETRGPEKNEQKKTPPKEEGKKDIPHICGPKIQVKAPEKKVVQEVKEQVCPESAEEAYSQCPPRAEKKRRECNEPEIPVAKQASSSSSSTPDKKLKGNIQYPCPRMKDSQKKKDCGIPMWQCGVISGIILLIAVGILIWSKYSSEPEKKDEKDQKGKKKK